MPVRLVSTSSVDSDDAEVTAGPSATASFEAVQAAVSVDAKSHVPTSSPTGTSAVSRLPAGASGQAHRGSYAHEGL